MSDHFKARFDAALKRAEAWLRGRGFHLTPLAPSPRFPFGFKTVFAAGGRSFPLDVLFAPDFPVSPPRLRVAPALRGVIPHVEVDGQLCLFQNGTEFAVGAVERVLEDTFRDAERVLGNPSNEDFLDEFQSYWPNQLPFGTHALILLSEIDLRTKSLVAAIASGMACVGTDGDMVLAWLRKSLGGKTPRSTEDVVLVLHVPRGLVPEEYPRNLWDLAELFRQHDSDAHGRLLRQIWASSADKVAIVSFQRNDKSIVGGVKFRSPRLEALRKTLSHSTPTSATSEADAIKTRLEKVPVVRMFTSTATHRHIHTRGGVGSGLEGKSVCLVGCGALGSHVAHILAKAGVGELRLIDPEVLTRDNVGRHLLGSLHFGMGKANALAKHLLMQLPHLRIACRSQRWREVWDSSPGDILRCDLVVSTIAHWNTEFDLNALVRRQKGFPAVIFGWIEAYAAAGHSLFVHSTMGGCFSCGCDDLGSFGHAVIAPGFDVGGRVAGCGDFFQPYGLAEMMPVAAMIAQQAMDAVSGVVTESELRTWTGPQSEFTKRNLPVTSKWSGALRAFPFGGGHRRPWAPAPTCRFCT